MNSNLENIFYLKHIDDEKIIIQVLADDTFKVAMFPFVSSDWEYITVTRGSNHILTVIKKDGTTFDFYWGFNGHTLISESLEVLKKKVLEFINESNILIEYNGGELKSARIYYNSNYKKWQLTINNGVHYWSDTAKSLSDMIEDCERFVIANNWKERIAPTGITVWDAEDMVFVFH